MARWQVLCRFFSINAHSLSHLVAVAVRAFPKPVESSTRPVMLNLSTNRLIVDLFDTGTFGNSSLKWCCTDRHPDSKNYEYGIFKLSQIAKTGNYLYFVAKTFISPNSGRWWCGKLPHDFFVTNRYPNLHFVTGNI